MGWEKTTIKLAVFYFRWEPQITTERRVERDKGETEKLGITKIL